MIKILYILIKNKLIFFKHYEIRFLTLSGTENKNKIHNDRKLNLYIDAFLHITLLIEALFVELNKFYLDYRLLFVMNKLLQISINTSLNNYQFNCVRSGNVKTVDRIFANCVRLSAQSAKSGMQ